MSSLNFRGLARVALVAGLSLGLSACFRPLYGPTASGQSLQTMLASIEVPEVQWPDTYARFGHYLRSELIYALKLLEDGVRTREEMNASWAGAMGLTQFMPSEYYTLAYDLDGDGRKDIWGSVPDALASAANQLRAKGWVPGQPWGFEVRLPAGIS